MATKKELNVAFFSDNDLFFEYDENMKKAFYDTPDIDVWVANGKLTDSGITASFVKFMNWFETLKSPYKIMMGGSSDWCLANKVPITGQAMGSYVLKQGNYYLEDSGCEIEGFKFWGIPQILKQYANTITPVWSVNDAAELRALWEKIPLDTDVLLTNTPPYDILDNGTNLTNLSHIGNEDLYYKVCDVRPKVHCFSTIGGFGIKKIGETHFVNSNMRGTNLRILYPYTLIKIEKYV